MTLRSLPPLSSGRLRLLTIATFSSGGCALLLEQIYEKYLSTLLGSSRPAATIVLAAFFLGLAIGGFCCPKKSAGSTRRLALLELFIAGWAVLVGLAFFPSHDFAAEWLVAASGSAGLLTTMRFALAVVWILPPTIAMGAQLPTLTAVLDSCVLRTPENLTKLYTVNLLGGLAFTLIAPIILFNYFGANGALWVAAALSAVVGLALWFGLPAPVETGSAVTAVATPPERIRYLEIFLAFASGYIFFALEVIWFHLISAVCGASTYSFSLLLAAILLALAVAGWLVSRQIRRSAGDLLLFVLSRLLPLLAVGCAAWPHFGRLFSIAQTRLRLESFWAGESLKFAVIMFAIVPSAIGLGMIFPVLLRGLAGDGAPGSRRIGWICTANVIGCVAGALIAGFLMIPMLGAERSFGLIWILVAAACVIQLWRMRATTQPVRSAVAWCIAGALLLFALPRWDRLELTRGFGVYFQDSIGPGAKLVFFDEDQHTGFVTVTETRKTPDAPPVHTLYQNGKFDADNSTQMSAQIGFATVSTLHAPAFRNALVIGCGSGQTASVVERFNFEHTEIVDLSPGHFRAAREWFADINQGVLDRPRVQVVVEDGRNWLLRSRLHYDMIQVEISSIWFAGATNLYSSEFYNLISRRLSPGGVLAQWVQLHHLTEAEIGSVLASIHQVLPYITVWKVGLQVCILASAEPQKWNPEAWERWTASPEFDQDRQITGLHTPEDVIKSQLVSSERAHRMFSQGSYIINTDRNRWLEFQTPKYYLNHSDLPGDNLRFLREAGQYPAEDS